MGEWVSVMMRAVQCRWGQPWGRGGHSRYYARLVTERVLVAVAIGVLSAALFTLSNAKLIDADTQTGTYSMDINVPSAVATLNQNFSLTVGMTHDFGSPQCTDGSGVLLTPIPAGCYAGVQWNVDYDESRVTIVSVTQAVGVPTLATCLSYVGKKDLLLGCLDIESSRLTYSGVFWDVVAFCKAPGAALFAISSQPPSPTVVNTGSETSALPIHLHNDTILCGDDADGDGCHNAEETSLVPALGGDRDPAYYWDFYDVNGTRSIGLADTLLILAHFGHGANDDALDNVLDRKKPDNTKPYRTAEDNNGIGLADALANLRSFGDSCSEPPGSAGGGGTGDYSMDVVIVPGSAAVGGANFTAAAAIVNPSAPATCTNGATNGFDDDGDMVVDEADELLLGDPLAVTPAGCYKAAQWYIDYDESLITIVSMTRLGAAPAECTSKNNNGSRVLLGCLSTTGAVMRYTGTAFNVVMNCKAGTAGGVAAFTVSTAAAETFVSDGVANLPIYARTDAIECTGGAP